MDIPQPIGEQTTNKESIGDAKLTSSGVISSPVPFHVHNGSDSPKIAQGDLQNISNLVQIYDTGGDSVIQYNGTTTLYIVTPNSSLVSGISIGAIGIAINYFGGILYLDGTALTQDRDVYFPNASGTIPVADSGTGAPGYTPSAIGLIYCDTSGGKVYISTGTTNSSDWKLLN